MQIIIREIFMGPQVTLLRLTQGDTQKKGKLHPCTGTEALYRLYGP